MRESLETNGCITGFLTVVIAFVVTFGMISFIVWSPCREDWPSDDITTTEPLSNTTEEFSSTLSSHTPTAESSPTTSMLTQSSYTPTAESSPTTSMLTQSSSVSTSVLTSLTTDSSTTGETVKNKYYLPMMALSSALKEGAEDLEPGRSESPLRPVAPSLLSSNLTHSGRALL